MQLPNFEKHWLEGMMHMESSELEIAVPSQAPATPVIIFTCKRRSLCRDTILDPIRGKLLPH